MRRGYRRQGRPSFATAQAVPGEWGERIACEYSALLEPGVGPRHDFQRMGHGCTKRARPQNKRTTRLAEPPGFLQAARDTGSGWRFLLQVDSTTVPFELNFGDGGIGYAFLSPDGGRGKFMWQSL